VLPGHFSTLAEANDAGLFAAPLDELKHKTRPAIAGARNRGGLCPLPAGNLPPFLPEYVNIKRVNAGLMAPSEDEASQLELGKNVCGLAASGNCKGEKE